jgi:alanine-glyoxylate transaminase/(R)-3-amino-2-methylpropionate-pyruvate transaminase
VKDPITKEPNTELLLDIFEKGREAGVLFGKGGHKGNLIRMLSPLCISKKSAEKAIGVFEDIIDGLPK